MKKVTLFVLALFAIVQLQAQNGVAISTSSSATPDATAILDVQSTTQGMLIPRMTEVQKNAISVSATSKGLLIYQTDGTPGFYFYDGSTWAPLAGATKIDDLSDGKVVYDGATEKSLAIGQDAGNNMTTWYNVAIGYKAMENCNTASSDFNTAVGNSAAASMTAGNNNAFFGYESGSNFNGASASDGHNTFIGSRSGHSTTTGSNNIAFGHAVDLSSATASNELNIANSIYATGLYTNSPKIGIGHEDHFGNVNNAPNSTLTVTGSLSLAYEQNGSVTLDETNYTYFADNNAVVTLPQANTCPGRIYIIKALGSSGATVNALSGETIDGSASISLIQYKYIMVQSGDGTSWWIIGQN